MPVGLTLIGGTFGVYASRSGRRAGETFSLFELGLFNLHRLVGRGRKEVPTSIHSQRRRIWYACQWIARASARDTILFGAYAAQF